MYKYFFVVWVSILNLNACEFMSGVTIENCEVRSLFEQAAELYKDDKVTSAIIENYYEQYLCLLASQDKKDTAPLKDVSIIENMKLLIASKEAGSFK